MSSFENFNLKKQLRNVLSELNFESPTAIQEQSYSVVLSGKDILGIAQTGTGKTLAYILPILNELPFSDQLNPRVLILVPTRELVIQVVDDIQRFTKYMSLRSMGIYGGVNIKTQRLALANGVDIVVATPGRLYDLALSQSLSLKGIKKLVIDEVDVMLDLGFRPQLTSILELLPTKRQNLMFSATMTDHVELLIDDFFVAPAKISIALSGTPLENIRQSCYAVENFYTKINLVKHLIGNKSEFHKVLIFVSHKRLADKVFDSIDSDFHNQCGVIHSNKTQNSRIRAIEDFDSGRNRILVTTDIMARGLDLDRISHVINIDTPNFPENYMHRIGRTGRAEEEGSAILLYTEQEKAAKERIEELMDYQIPQIPFPSTSLISKELLPEERPDEDFEKNPNRNAKGFKTVGQHEKKEKNKKVNLGGSYKREIAKKYKKPQTRGDKGMNTKKR